MDLEQRHCACGCGRTFRTLPTSTARYATILHNPNRSSNYATIDFIRRARHIKKMLDLEYGPERLIFDESDLDNRPFYRP